MINVNVAHLSPRRKYGQRFVAHLSNMTICSPTMLCDMNMKCWFPLDGDLGGMEELLFGDTVKFWELDSSRYWELDVTPPSVEPLQQMENPEEIVGNRYAEEKGWSKFEGAWWGGSTAICGGKGQTGQSMASSPNCTESGQRPRPRSCCDEI